MPLTEKQTEYIRSATHRWNFKVGAARAGKTWCDFYLIPMRIRACGEDGIVLLMGHTVGTLCRNVLDPMRQIWGEALVGATSGKSDSVMLFGRRCYLLGAEKAIAASKLQGSSIVYCYGDEVTTWSEEVFTMLKSRLDKPHACFDGTCNPDCPTHWLKRFLDSDADVYVQHYVMDDNPNLSEAFLQNIKAEYAGTVWYDRLILGKWVAAQGVIYRAFANDPGRFVCSDEALRDMDLQSISVGVDFGGTKSGTSFVAVGITRGYRTVVVLRSVRYFGEVDTEVLGERFLSFLQALSDRYGLPMGVRCDSAEPILIRTLRGEVRRAGLPVILKSARKGQIRDRIRLTLTLMARGNFFLREECGTLSRALCGAVWNDRGAGDERLDDGSSDIDSLDALEYALEPWASKLLQEAV